MDNEMTINTFMALMPPEAEMVSLGRNGWAKTRGIELTPDLLPDTVILTPVTNKMQTQRCEIRITPEAMDQMAQWWIEYRERKAKGG